MSAALESSTVLQIDHMEVITIKMTLLRRSYILPLDVNLISRRHSVRRYTLPKFALKRKWVIFQRKWSPSLLFILLKSKCNRDVNTSTKSVDDKEQDRDAMDIDVEDKSSFETSVFPSNIIVRTQDDMSDQAYSYLYTNRHRWREPRHFIVSQFA